MILDTAQDIMRTQAQACQHLVLYARAEPFRSAFRARLLPEGDGRLLYFSMVSCRSWVFLVSLNILESKADSVIILSRSFNILSYQRPFKQLPLSKVAEAI